MNILVFVNKDLVIYNFKKELLSALIKLGHHVTVAVPYGEKNKLLANLGCDLIHIEIDRRGVNPIKDFKLYRNFRKILKTLKPELVLNYTIKCNTYGGIACQKEKIPYISNVTGLGSSFNGGLITIIITFLEKIAFNRVSFTIFENSSDLQTFLDKKIIPLSKCVLMPGAGVNVEKFVPAETVSNNRSTNFLYFGRIMKEKGIEELLYAAKKLKNEKIPCSVSLIGFFDDDLKEKVQASVEHGEINYYEFQSDVKKYIHLSDCVVLPSYHEGMSNALLESAAMGKPLIASDIPGCRECILDGENGFLAQPKNREDLYEKMKCFALLNHGKKQEMGKKSRALVEKNFDRKIVTERTLKLIMSAKEKRYEN